MDLLRRQTREHELQILRARVRGIGLGLVALRKAAYAYIRQKLISFRWELARYIKLLD